MTVDGDDTIDEWAIIMNLTGSARSTLTGDPSNTGVAHRQPRHCYDCQAMWEHGNNTLDNVSRWNQGEDSMELAWW